MLTDTTIRRLETLGELAQQGKRINGLFRLLENSKLWVQAYANIHNNKGAVTKGADGTSLDGMSIERINQLINAVKHGQHWFTPVRRVQIPKVNGKTRPLGIPNGNDKLVQEVIRMILEKIYEPIFSNSSHGFRQSYSCHTALMQVKQKWTSIKWLINMDIKSFFDTIDHEVMMNILAKRIDDNKFLKLIYSVLKAGYIEDWKFHHTYSGTPQGGIVSPILANIYLNELDEYIKVKQAKFNRGKRRAAHHEYTLLSETIKRRMKRIDQLKQKSLLIQVDSIMQEIKTLRLKRKELPSSDPMDMNYKRLVYIRYADDFIIGIIGAKSEAIALMQEVKEFIQNELHLTIAEDKSGIVHAKDGVRFLGYEIHTYTGNRVVKTTRSGRHTTTRSVSARMQLHIPQEQLKKFCEQKGYGTYNTYKPKHRNALIYLSEAEIVKTYNAEMRGLANYYGLAINAKRDLSKLQGLWQGSLYKTLAAKRKSSVAKVAKSLRQGNKGSALIVSMNDEKYIFPIYNMSTMMEQKLISYSRVDLKPNTWQFTLSHTELIQRMAAKQCEYCGTRKGPFEVHHIKKLADVSKGKQLWQIMMSRRLRKTLVMCTPCHVKLHVGKL